MVKKFFSPSEKLKTEWPEIFGDISSNIIPLKYVDNIIVKFSDGREWEIDISDNLENCSFDDAYLKVNDILEEYENEILDIDFNIDIIQFKKDMMISVNKLN